MTRILPIGVANSVSANFQFDPLDTLQFAKQGNFEIIQIYLSTDLLRQTDTLEKIKAQQADFSHIYYHAEGFLNEKFLEDEYHSLLFSFLSEVRQPNFIIHFDERDNIDKMIHLLDTLSQHPFKIYIENYFLSSGKEAGEKNLKKFLALFTLSTNFGQSLYPVLDIPRLFHQQVGFSTAEALEWSYQIINFFGNRQIPLLLHLIDSREAQQSRPHYSAIGEGYLPYKELFHFLEKTRPRIDGIILEFEDKIKPLQSRDYIRKALKNSLP